ENKVDVWAVYQQKAIDTDTYRDARGFRVAAKLKPGVSLEQAQAEMDVITARLAEQYPEDKGYGAIVIGMREGVAGDFRTPLIALLGALGFVLLLACVNISNLQLVRLEARRKELAMRTALGAGRLRLMKQLLIESLLFVLLAGVLGILLAPQGVKLLLWLVPPQEIPWLQVKTSTSVLMVSLGLTFVAAILAGLLPALRISRIDLTRVLNGGTATSGSVNRRLRNAFVVAQIALAVIPLTGSGLLMNSLLRLQGVNPGFQSDHRLTFSYSAPRARYKDAAAIAQLAERIREEVQNTAGVKAAGLVQNLPFSPAVGWLQAISRQDPKGNPADLPHVRYTVATSGYFEALNIPLKLGRTFTKADTQDSLPVVVINESMAKRYFANEDPIGKPLWIGHAQALPGSAPRTIVGVVGDTLLDQLDTTPESSAWVPISQQLVGEDVWRNLFLVAHTESDPIAMFPAIRQRIASVDSELALTNITTMDNRIGDSVWRQRFTANVLSAFSLVALAIASLGVFGITSYLVSQRTREIGVRMALGALPGDIFRLVMKEGALSVLLGIIAGLIGSYYLTRFLTGLLYGVQPTDPVTFISVAVLLALVASLACSLSARKATKVDPMIALKSE
ncbi:MAG TPA: ABC transporter permease, partial [Blastocatellia bacterium]|nr:ABC transporter permease [Blastocatellia bacterium]